MSEATAAPTVRIIRTRPGGDSKNPASEYSSLLHTVRNLGLLGRATGYYWVVFSILVVTFLGAAAGFVLLGDSWFQLLIAAALGIIFTQFAFLAHEASHRAVFTSGPANDRAGRVLANLFVGISYAWWMTKHSRHHANPNVIGKDPDIEPDVIRFNEKDASEVNWLTSFITRKQGYLFFPLLTLEGINLHIHGFKTVFGKGKVDKRATEIAMLTTRIVLYVAVIFYFLPIGMAFAFIGVQMAVFGVYMGASFAPNHKGMPQLPADSRVDFLRRQVLTSRNIKGGLAMDTFMGGLNYQIEHHLFPNMARPHLKKAREIAKEYCDSHSINYTETGLFQSYGIVIEYLNRVGLAARDPFDCPMVTQFRRS
ncbi:acyl-CoA desaturase [Cryobacterium frigoriphilum]|uniref:Acyl-CoA desaturase n=1 Tax=Cryobacterium frigoriphilum TaxID=1259150 RepID=A0A4V3IRT1_9MICO|nr:acyl-CoA desaturase [Cryobacterium frigoriphilum]TFD53477.1 acyl-CoA desaturase [Cryobacterium frigoriphilum]